MINSKFIRGTKETNWQVYLGVGIMSALMGYLLSALPQLIAPLVFITLSVWLIYSGLQDRPDRAIVPSPMEVLRRSQTVLVYCQSCSRARWGQFRFGVERSRWWQMSSRRAWQLLKTIDGTVRKLDTRVSGRLGQVLKTITVHKLEIPVSRRTRTGSPV
jgi:hypothetical protein